MSDELKLLFPTLPPTGQIAGSDAGPPPASPSRHIREPEAGPLWLPNPQKLQRGTLFTARAVQNIDSVELKDSRANAPSTQRQSRQADGLVCLENSVMSIRS